MKTIIKPIVIALLLCGMSSIAYSAECVTHGQVAEIARSKFVGDKVYIRIVEGGALSKLTAWMTADPDFKHGSFDITKASSIDFILLPAGNPSLAIYDKECLVSTFGLTIEKMGQMIAIMEGKPLPPPPRTNDDI